MGEMEKLFKDPANYLYAVGVGALVGVWWARMTPNQANLTIVFGVVAIGIATAFKFSGEPVLVRALWTTAVVSVLGLTTYYVLWSPSVEKPTVASGAKAKDDEKPVPIWSVVTVHPAEFLLHTGKSSNTVQLTVTNTGAVPLYSVALDISTVPKEAFEGIKFDTDRDANSIKQKIGGVEIDSDVMGLGYTDSLELRFYQLLPNQPRRVTVSGGTAVKSNGRAQITFAQVSPAPLMRQSATPKR